MNTRRQQRALWTAIAAVLLLCACVGGGQGGGSAANGEQTLRELARAHDIDIGSAVSPAVLKDPGVKNILAAQFNSLTPENELKFYTIRAQKGYYNFAPADELVAFAEEHGMKVRGHTLIWHKYQPRWLEDASWTREEMLSLLKDYITTVVGRYKGRIYCWDVVNEVVDDVGDLVLGNDSIWYRALGEDY
ncbi:MAG TPA: 1,4-beta-xylanase, partial [Spirochaetia bacterium]|nr:1,4-beta-xylanase [Spirochaetia bacterium]